MDFVYVGSLQVLRSLKVMVILRDADNSFLALITFLAEFTDTDTDTDTGNLHTPHLVTHLATHPQVQLCISVGHEGDQLESWKFYYICKKGCCIHSWPQI